jgi:hypothetical protein
MALVRLQQPLCSKSSLNQQHLRQKGHSQHAATRDRHLRAGIVANFDDNAINGIVAFGAQSLPCERRVFDWK